MGIFSVLSVLALSFSSFPLFVYFCGKKSHKLFDFWVAFMYNEYVSK